MPSSRPGANRTLARHVDLRTSASRLRRVVVAVHPETSSVKSPSAAHERAFVAASIICSRFRRAKRCAQPTAST